MSHQMQSEIADLNVELEKLDDPRSCVALVQARIRAYRQAGEAVPEALARIERRLMSECMAQSQGR